jgi:exopolysaccharide biosynthesis polyprenyl glycosylphosphotransferase
MATYAQTQDYIPTLTAAPPRAHRRVLIVGAGPRGQGIAQKLALTSPRCEVVGYVDDDPSRGNGDGLRVLGGLDETIEIAQRHGVDEIIVAYAPSWQEQLLRGLRRVGAESVDVKVLPTFYEVMLDDSRLERLDDTPLIPMHRAHTSAAYEVAKRAFDLVFAGLLLIATSPLLLLAALLIKCTSRGPVFYRQTRVGRMGRAFTIAKLRTMVANAEAHTGPVLAEAYDRRVTLAGRLLRRLRLDEVPQAWNVIKGDMSIVGPRPERPCFVTQFQGEVPGYAERLKVRPGITGLAQVCGDYETSVYDKVRYDWLYVFRRSLWLDLKILLRTIGVVLRLSGT